MPHLKCSVHLPSKVQRRHFFVHLAAFTNSDSGGRSSTEMFLPRGTFVFFFLADLVLIFSSISITDSPTRVLGFFARAAFRVLFLWLVVSVNLAGDLMDRSHKSWSPIQGFWRSWACARLGWVVYKRPRQGAASNMWHLRGKHTNFLFCCWQPSRTSGEKVGQEISPNHPTKDHLIETT